MPSNETVPAEILTFSCYRCGEVLETEFLTDEIEVCRCGATALDHGAIRIDIGFDAGMGVDDS